MSEPNDDMNENVLIALRQIIQAIDLHSRNLAKNYGLTGPQLVILRKLSKTGQSPIGKLAKEINLRHATVTRILDRLEKRGFIRRKRNDSDRRSLLVDITDKTRDLIETAPPLLHDRFVSEFGKLLDWEKNLILSSLQRIASMMKAEEIDAVPVLVSGPLAATEKETIEFLDETKGEGDGKDGSSEPSESRRREEKNDES